MNSPEVVTVSDSIEALIEELVIAAGAADPNRARTWAWRILNRYTRALVHEIRNPLGAIATSVDFLSQSAPPGDRDADVRGFLSSDVDRLDNVLEAAVEFTADMQLEVRTVDAGALLREASTADASEAQISGVVLDVSSDAGLTLEADGAWLLRAFHHVVRNAIEASSKGAAVSLRANQRDGDHVVFTVADSGTGIPSNAADVFDAFVSHKPGHVGLGLTIARRIVDAHGGEIGLHSGASGGTVAEVVLPIRRPV